MAIQVVILAAGQGTRLHSNIPKVLHQLAGKPLLRYVLDAAFALPTERKPLVVVGHQHERIRHTFADDPLIFVEQEQQLGTAHAVLQTLAHIDPDDDVLILYGDVPLINTQTLRQLTMHKPEGICLLTALFANPQGYGRIKRDAQQRVISIIEEKDANDAERALKEINSGVYFLNAALLKRWLPQIQKHNAQTEFYLTDIIKQANQEQIQITTLIADEQEVSGVNDRIQLALLERHLQLQRAHNLMRAGVTLLDPARIDIRGELHVGKDVTIDVNVIIAGDVSIGDGCSIGPHSYLRNTVLGRNVEVKAHSLLDGVEVAADCIIGPFARLRPGCVLAEGVHVGNFVEVKNSAVGSQTKINHLSYIGDSEIGARVNVGAGTITCNYDGVNKHKTIIGDDTFIGSDTQLVAPVTVGARATIGAGSTIIKDAAADCLTLTHRIEQRSIPAWQRPKVKED